MDKILFLFAHQDDECFIFSRIRYEISMGNEVYCIYLTDGSFYNISSSIRDQESRNVLNDAGVKTENIFFLGSAHDIQDGSLIEEIENAAALSLNSINKIGISKLFCLSWEGGHHDHDASHLVALSIGKKLDILDNMFQYSMYNGAGVPWRFFRVMAPLKENGKSISRELPFREAFNNLSLCFKYRSQRKTWTGLFPEALVKFLVFRREVMQAVGIQRTKEKPHKGKLLYERMFDVRFEYFMEKTEDFRNRYIY